MSSEIKIFDFDGYNKIRGVFYLGKPWFVAEDICRLLDVGNTRSTLVLLDEEDKGIHLIDDKFGRQELPVITEAGVYSIIFRSRHASARAVKRWLTHEVLPGFRGAEEAQISLEKIKEILSNPDMIIRLATEYKGEKR